MLEDIDISWKWGHEYGTHGMRDHNMCGPFFGRNLSGIIRWMKSETGASLNAWGRRVKRENGQWNSLSDLALQNARAFAGTWPHHFWITAIAPHSGHETYCQRCGVIQGTEENWPLDPNVCYTSNVPKVYPFQMGSSSPDDLPF